MTIGVVGAGAFGTALALTFARVGPVVLWGRNTDLMAEIRVSRDSGPRLPGYVLPNEVTVTSAIPDLDRVDVLLLCLPMQQLRSFIAEHPDLPGHKVVCCKGLDLISGEGPTSMVPAQSTAILSGPSFADDIARGLPTALTLACADATTGAHLQTHLTTPDLRLYRSTDVTGVELGGALKNVIAIACGAVMGAGLGVSARAALMTRGFAEIQRLALSLGAERETLQGLSGFGDLALTCTSEQSRNYRYGFAMGAGQPFDAGTTVEGRATAEALLRHNDPAELPICAAVANLCAGRMSMKDAVLQLMQRPLKEE